MGRGSSRTNSAVSGRRRVIAIAAVVAAAVIVVVSIAVYRERVAPFRAAVLVVDDNRVSMGYFLKRAYLADQAPLETLEELIDEEIIKLEAPNPPYNIRVDDDDVDRFLREMAQGEDASMSDEVFEEWYRQQLNESRLSDQEFRELARTNLLARGMSRYLAERVPTVSEQVRLRMIVVPTFTEAERVKRLLDDGEPFADLARQYSIDEQAAANGGDAGWFPRRVLAPHVGRAVFDELAVGEPSDPLVLDGETYTVVTVTERAAGRQIDEGHLRLMRSRALQDWLSEQEDEHEVEFHGLTNGYDSETEGWVQWQLTRMESAGTK